MHTQHTPPILLHLTQPTLTPTSKKTPSAQKLFSSIQRQLQSNRQLIYLKNNKNIYDKIQQALERKLLNNKNQKGMSVKQQFDVKEMILICKQRKHCRGLGEKEGDRDGKREGKREGLGGSGVRDKDKGKLEQNLLGYKVNNFNEPLYTNRSEKKSAQQTQRNMENNKKIKMRPKTGLTRCNTQTTRISSAVGEGKQLFASAIVQKPINNSTNRKLRKQSKRISDSYTTTTNFMHTFRHQKQNKDPTKNHRKMLTSPSFFSPSPHPSHISSKKSHIPSKQPLSTYNTNHQFTHQQNLSKFRAKSPKQVLKNRFSEIINSCESEQSDMQYIGQKIGYFQYFWKKVDNQRSTMNDFCKLVDKIKVDIDVEDYE